MYGIDRYTILAADGLQITTDAEHSFRIDNSGNKIAISVVGLPESAQDASEGQIYLHRNNLSEDYTLKVSSGGN